MRVKPEIKDFIEEVLMVCEKHNMFISHEDYQGGFLIEINPKGTYRDKLVDWFRRADLPEGG